MSFSDIVQEARAASAEKSKRELAAYLERNGVPSTLGDLQLARHHFRELSGADFDKTLTAAKAATRRKA